jgi:hypothetical protein
MILQLFNRNGIYRRCDKLASDFQNLGKDNITREISTG